MFKKIPFVKMAGHGNDFIMIDNRKLNLQFDVDSVKKICIRKYGVGADGIILLEDSKDYDFKMIILNDDGSQAEMCGNGARCLVDFANQIKLIDKDTQFEAEAGLHYGKITEHGIKIQMIVPHSYEMKLKLSLSDGDIEGSFVNTGVPHFVTFCQNLGDIDVKLLGKEIRYNDHFKPKGANVNFAQIISSSEIKVRTYERGVEDETEACGTGSVAVAVLAWKKGLAGKHVDVHTHGGILKIDIEGDDHFEVFMTGPVRRIYEGVLGLDI